MRFATIPALSAVDASQNQSAVIDASDLFAFSVQAISSGSNPNGTLKVQFSNELVSPTHWSDITSATVSLTNNGTYAIIKFDSAYQWLRLVWTASSGTGALTAWIAVKGV